MARPIRPAARLRLTESAPRLALTSVDDSTFTLAGSAPELICSARVAADWAVKLPVIEACPLGMGFRIVGFVSSLPPCSGGSARDVAFVSQVAMSWSVRSSKIAM